VSCVVYFGYEGAFFANFIVVIIVHHIFGTILL